MMLGECPGRGRMLIGTESVRALVNVEPGVIVVWWDCPCGEDHLTTSGRRAAADPALAAAAVRAVRASMDGPAPVEAPAGDLVRERA